ncbi:hypothetical protein AAMO2058_000852900 [Amorphochlora amoebiformis]|mmetsp:Transcript_2869/g.4368  ORF Transcript_2869/g.4368 Transcript_2869/m.4368 type:complete len:215 (-) Transcript_2869:200-844(-)
MQSLAQPVELDGSLMSQQPKDQEVAQIILSFDWRHISVDDAYCKMLGYSEADLKGRQMWDVIHHGDVERCQAEIATAARTGTSNVEFSCRMNCEDGSLVAVQTRVKNMGQKELKCSVRIVSTKESVTHHLWKQLNDMIESFREYSSSLKATRLSQSQRSLLGRLEAIVIDIKQLVSNNTAGPPLETSTDKSAAGEGTGSTTEESKYAGRKRQRS